MHFFVRSKKGVKKQLKNLIIKLKKWFNKRKFKMKVPKLSI